MKDQRINNPDSLAPVGHQIAKRLPLSQTSMAMTTALFTNFTSEEFTGWWDGKAKKFAPGQSIWMPDYLASHFAKHLVNRELLRKGDDGKLIYPDGEKYTSPKKPEEVPVYMDLFNKAYQEDDAESIGDQKDDIDTLINVANKNRQEKKQPEEAKKEDPAPKGKQDPNEPQIADFPEDDGDEDEAQFNNK